MILLSASSVGHASRGLTILHGELRSFDTATLTTQPLASSVPGLENSPAAMAIRPKTGQLYAVAFLSPADGAQLYRIDDLRDPAAVFGRYRAEKVGGRLPLAAVDLSTYLAFDFDPVTDRAHVITPSGKSYLIDPDTGAVTTKPDVPFRVVAIAYANVPPQGADVGVYTAITLVNPHQPTPQLQVVRMTADTPTPSFTSAPLALTFEGHVSLDHRPTDGALFMFRRAFDGTGRLYTIDWINGQPTEVGPIADMGGSMALQGYAPTIYGVTTFHELVRFRADVPIMLRTPAGELGGTPTVITGPLQPSEEIVALDSRIATGEIYAVSNQSRLFTLDPATAALTLRGTLAVPITGPNIGMSIDPVTDRIRLTSRTGEHVISGFTGADAVAGPPLDPGLLAIANDANLHGTTTTRLYGYRASAPPTQEFVRIDPGTGGFTAYGASPHVAAVDKAAYDIAPDGDFAFLAMPYSSSEAWSNFYLVDLATGTGKPSGLIGEHRQLRAMTVAPRGFLQVTPPTQTVHERPQPAGGRPAQLTVRRVAGNDGPLAAYLFPYGVTVSPRYTASAPQRLIFASGAALADRTIDAFLVQDDAAPQPDDTVWIYYSESAISEVTQPARHVDVLVKDDDAGKPALQITTPPPPAYETSETLVALLGTATAGADPIARVLWSSDRGGSGVATGTVNWSASIPLAMGANVITIVAEDAATPARQTLATLTVTRVVPPPLTYYLAEGATGGFFSMDIALANPGDAPAPIRLRFLDANDLGLPEVPYTLAPRSRTTIHVNDLPGMSARIFSTIVTSTNGVPIVVERTIRWGGANAYYGMSTDSAQAAPAPRWYFAEGAQGFFNTYLLLANPSSAVMPVTIRFLREGADPVEKTRTLAPWQRETVDVSTVTTGVNDTGEPLSGAFGMEVTFHGSGIAERAMYFGSDPFWKGGDGTAGVTAPSRDWFFAEGATGSYWVTFMLIVNPSLTDTADVDVSYLTTTGTVVAKRHPVGPGQRISINIAGEDPRLAAATVGTTMRASIPVLAERTQYWGGSSPLEWIESHSGFGVTAPARRWGVAEGRLGGSAGSGGSGEAFSTYVLIANPGSQPATVHARFLREDGREPIVREAFVVPANSRVTLFGDVPVEGLTNERFSTILESDQPIVVERAMYADALGQHWKAGTNSTGTPLAPVVP